MEWGRAGDFAAGVWEVSVWSYTIKAILKGNTKWSLLPFPSTSLPLSPCGPALSPLLQLPPLPLFLCTECPIDGPGVLYITPSCTSNAKQTNFWLYPSSFHLPLPPRSPWHPSACCKSLNAAKQGSWFKHRRFIGKRKSYIVYIRD